MMPLTGIPILDWFLNLLDAWGYLIVFGFTVFENLFVIGSLTPGETVVIAASAVASNGQLVVAGSLDRLVHRNDRRQQHQLPARQAGRV